MNFLTFFIWMIPSVTFASCLPERVELRGDFGMAGFHVELADEPAERALGLMHRQELSKSAGMLFVYEYPQKVAFWMRNTLIPLDMIFVDEAGRVVQIHENAKPLDTTHIRSETEVLAVLEISGGLASALGIKVGAELRHESMPQEKALWSCAN